MEQMNTTPTRRDSRQALPSGVSPYMLKTLPKTYGSQPDLLTPVPESVIEEMQEAVGGSRLIRFVTDGYEGKVKRIQDQLGLSEFTIYNAWSAFEAILPLMPALEPEEIEYAERY